MATMISVKFGDLMLQLGDGEVDPGPEGFEDVCGFTAYSHDFNISTETEDLPDCNDANIVGFEAPVKVSVGEAIGVQGIVSPTNFDVFRDLAYETEPTNIRWVWNKAPKTGYYEGPAILTALQGGNWERRKSGTFNGTLTFVEKPIWVPAP